MTLITTNTSSGAATSDFTTGIDNTYKLYIFKFYDVNPATDLAEFTFQANAAGASGYNETMTTTFFYAYHYEDDSVTGMGYNASYDQAQGTAYQQLNVNQGSGSDESLAGELHLFNPSSTTYVKHFMGRSNTIMSSDKSEDGYVAGYCNVTAAIDAVQFKFASGNIDAGTIKLFGIKDS